MRQPELYSLRRDIRAGAQGETPALGSHHGVPLGAVRLKAVNIAAQHLGSAHRLLLECGSVAATHCSLCL